MLIVIVAVSLVFKRIGKVGSIVLCTLVHRADSHRPSPTDNQRTRPTATGEDILLTDESTRCEPLFGRHNTRCAPNFCQLLA